MSVRRPRFEDEAPAETINVTSLIDIIFILLLFFIVTMGFVDGSVMKIDMPAASNVNSKASGAVNVAIDADGSISLDGVSHSLSSVSVPLKKRFAENPVLVLISDSRVSVSRLVEVMDLAKECGAQEIYVAAEKK